MFAFSSEHLRLGVNWVRFFTLREVREIDGASASVGGHMVAINWLCKCC